MWAKIGRSLLLILIVTVATLGGIDSAYAWKTHHVLANAAHAAAKITISTPLNARNCRDTTPCSIESAAAAAKSYLLSAGLNQASCIDPKRPSFSGVLVWVFSCDGSSVCNTGDAEVCIKVDMTPVAMQRDGTFIPYTRATVQCPHT
ncbi:MAG: hypothetical protein WA594_17415, partial [Candidatus Sulfotelmatobacter sp.]